MPPAPSAVAPDAVEAGCVGFLDAVESGRVYGWAWDPAEPERRLALEVFHAGRAIGTVVADRHRSDLAEGGAGDGRHAFVLDLPAELRSAHPDEFAVYPAGSRLALPRGPRLMQAPLEPREGGAEAALAALAFRVSRAEAMLASLAGLAGGLARELRGQRGRIEDLAREGAVAERLGEAAARLEAQASAVASLELFVLRLDAQLSALAGLPDPALAPRRRRRLWAAAIAAAIALLAALLLALLWRPLTAALI